MTLDPKALEAGMAEEKVSELLAAMDAALSFVEGKLIAMKREKGLVGVWCDAFRVGWEAARRTPTPVTEDVGWRGRRGDYPIGTKAFSIDGGYWTRVDGGWKWHLGDVFPSLGADAFKVEIPASHSPPKADGPGERVKLLEWQESNEGYARGQWFADTMLGEYCTYMHVPSGRAWLKGPRVGEFYDTIADAKAAAQQDYEARIRSALVSPSIKREA